MAELNLNGFDVKYERNVLKCYGEKRLSDRERANRMENGDQPSVTLPLDEDLHACFYIYFHSQLDSPTINFQHGNVKGVNGTKRFYFKF